MSNANTLQQCFGHFDTLILIQSSLLVRLLASHSEAVETRHALHGVQWPTSNPKCLNVDFGSESQMERALASTNDEVKPAINLRDDRSHHAWDRTDGDRDKVFTSVCRTSQFSEMAHLKRSRVFGLAGSGHYQ